MMADCETMYMLFDRLQNHVLEAIEYLGDDEI